MVIVWISELATNFSCLDFFSLDFFFTPSLFNLELLSFKIFFFGFTVDNFLKLRFLACGNFFLLRQSICVQVFQCPIPNIYKLTIVLMNQKKRNLKSEKFIFFFIFIKNSKILWWWILETTTHYSPQLSSLAIWSNEDNDKCCFDK